jgi:predicted GNAT family acetyltransferase
VRFVLTRDPSELSGRADAFIAGRIERNVLATVLMNAVAGGYEGLFAYGLDDRGDVAYAGLRTPPWPLLTSELDPRHARELIEIWLAEDPELNGVNGVPDTARAIASAWTELTGGATRLRMSDAMHALAEVRDPPRRAPGALRVARLEERDLVVTWSRAFIVEARAGGGPGEAERIADTRLAAGGILVWDDGGPACLLGVAPPVAGVVRIGPVYTPPERRRRGYAGTAVAAASRRALEHGAARCMLFTDVSNPTSNKIYAEVGYERFGDWEEHVFELARYAAAR